ncbi:DoxX family protein [Bradyrhizobium xenonodulans]|uniref:DoxX family protein n=1 Tax=Bradyrhizobium xenonodulans TaxID=2736875 RepID=A0ABY7MQL2_9BRAD|nr:DoxX family protein [Bradyrhizobium xenonodulans]WBL80221.1 DoxX family protein [Bradyrhizobium xenonodulans]
MRSDAMTGLAQRRAPTPLLLPGLRQFYEIANPASYALLRVTFGLILLTHGLPKLLGESHGAMANPFASSVNFITNTLHFPAPVLFGYVVMLLETFGAVMLAAGLFTRLIAPMVAVQMAMICLIHYPKWAWIDRGMEYPFLMGLVALHISFRGGGQLSLDRLIGREL